MAKEKRVQVSCSLPPAKAERLQRECDGRLLSPSVLLERGIDKVFAEFDQIAEGMKQANPQPKP